MYYQNFEYVLWKRTRNDRRRVSHYVGGENDKNDWRNIKFISYNAQKPKVHFVRTQLRKPSKLFKEGVQIYGQIWFFIQKTKVLNVQEKNWILPPKSQRVVQGGKIGRSFQWCCRILTFGLILGGKRTYCTAPKSDFARAPATRYDLRDSGVTRGYCIDYLRKLCRRLQDVTVLPPTRITSATACTSSETTREPKSYTISQHYIASGAGCSQ